MKEKQAMIEGILFSMGTSVSKKQLKTALNVDDDLLEYLIDQLKREYKRPERGIRLLEFDDSIQLCTKPEYYEALIRIVTVSYTHLTLPTIYSV